MVSMHLISLRISNVFCQGEKGMLRNQTQYQYDFVELLDLHLKNKSKVEI